MTETFMEEVVHTDLSTYIDIWTADKTRAARAGADMDLSQQLPTSDEIIKIFAHGQRNWQAPPVPFTPLQSEVQAKAKEHMDLLQALWNADAQMPQIEVVPATEFLQVVNRYEAEVTRRLGYGSPLVSPPKAMLSPYHGRVLIPDQLIVRDGVGVADQQSVFGAYPSSAHPWEESHFYSTLALPLSQSLFRQARGEWRKGYIAAAHALDSDALSSIKHANEAVCVASLEHLAALIPSWDEHLLRDKIPVVWQSEQGMSNYRSVIALAKDRTYANIACADYLHSVRRVPRRIDVCFFTTHPQHDKKYEKFFGEKP
jgi:hypothetical protein